MPRWPDKKSESNGSEDKKLSPPESVVEKKDEVKKEKAVKVQAKAEAKADRNFIHDYRKHPKFAKFRGE